MPHGQDSANGGGVLGSATRSRWFNNFLASSGFEAPSSGFSQIIASPASMSSSTMSFGGLDLDDIEPEAAVEVGEDLVLDDRRLSLAYNLPRHIEEIKGSDVETQSWRMRERMKTVSVALVICLNVGVDPPDVTKTQPCARVECWIDPMTVVPQKALESIGNNLQRQYERWQPRARYRQSLDPTVEEVRRLATGLRRNARDDRVLFHYNGHGVPKPTTNGEIWVFNRSYTQYIPLSLYDLQSWMGSPSIFVYDCSNAGIIVSCFEQFAEQHEREYLEQVNAQGVSTADLPPPISPRSCIQLAACAANQLLPMNPELPADLFTACLTTPIKMALRWFVMQNQGKLAPRINLDMLDKIPGQFGDRRTMLGELNWIFTAITDTIAWNTLPRPLFQKLFRQDLLVASLFRNFLLAERVMRSYDCTPVSQPSLPPTHQHPIWQAWDLAVDIALSQLPSILDHDVPYKASTFFEEQLTAFEVWLKYGNEQRPPPEQLPIVLQVLLSQAHRLRALDLLGQFLDLGPWAVNLALSVGIFPYVLKLLQSSARELRPLLVSIWAKILSVDSSCQNDLVRDASHKYFINVLQDDCMMPSHRTWASFILAAIVHNYSHGQQAAEQSNLIAICLEHLDDPEPVLRQWLAIAVGRVWDHYAHARWRGARDNAHEKLYELLKDPVPEVRAAAVFALGTFINSCEERTEHANNLDHAIALHLLKACEDGSPLVRQELVVALQYVVLAFESNFVNVCLMAAEEEEQQQQLQQAKAGRITSPAAAKNKKHSTGSHKMSAANLQPSASSSCLDRLAGGGLGAGGIGLANRSSGSLSVSMSALSSFGHVYNKIYSGLIHLSSDPHFDVSNMATKLIDYLRQRAIEKEAAVAARNSHPESVSVPSSPARPTYMPMASQTNTMRPSLAGNVTTIVEESVETSLSSSVDARTSVRAHRAVRAGSVGRHPSGGQHATNTSTVGGASPLITTSTSNLTSTASPELLSRTALSTNGVAGSPAGRMLSTSTRQQTAPPQLTTDFISWSAKYFTKQLMVHECISCDCDQESERHWRREWLFQRNNEVRLEAEIQCDHLRHRRGRIDGSPSVSGGPSVLRNAPAISPSAIAFHPFSPEVVIAGQNKLTVWNTHQGRRLSIVDIHDGKNNFAATNSSITSIDYINAHDEAILLAACDDGSIKLFRDYSYEATLTSGGDGESASEDGDIDLGGGIDGLVSSLGYSHKTKLVAAWNGLRDVPALSNQPSLKRGGSNLFSSMANLSLSSKTSLAGLVGGNPGPGTVRAAWSQRELLLAVGGSDSRYIRLWDAKKELRQGDLPTCTESPLQRLSFGPSHLGLLCAGFADGSVRLYDVRSQESRVLSFENHEHPILDCCLKGDEHNQTTLVVGDAGGNVNYYELRNPQTSFRYSKLANISLASSPQGVTELAIHPRADLLASWTQQSVNLYHVNPNTIANYAGNNAALVSSCLVNTIKYHDEGVLGQRLGHEGLLAFHPHLIQIAVGSKDGAVSLKRFKKFH